MFQTLALYCCLYFAHIFGLDFALILYHKSVPNSFFPLAPCLSYASAPELCCVFVPALSQVPYPTLSVNNRNVPKLRTRSSPICSTTVPCRRTRSSQTSHLVKPITLKYSGLYISIFIIIG